MDRVTKVEERLASVEERLLKVEERIAQHDEILIRVQDRLLKVEERLAMHDEKFVKIEEELLNLRRNIQEGFNIMNARISRLEKQTIIIDRRLRNVESYVEKISLEIEEEAREIIAYMLKQKGIIVDQIIFKRFNKEINIFAEKDNLCILGEAKTKISQTRIIKIDRKFEKFLERNPEYKNRKIIKVAYAIRFLPEAVEVAKKRNIWLITMSMRELTELKL